MKAVAATIHVIGGALIALFGGFMIVEFASLLMAVPFSDRVFIPFALCLGLGIYLIAQGLRQIRLAATTLKQTSADLRSTEDRLDELERLKRRDMVTPEEYTAKRQEILKDL